MASSARDDSADDPYLEPEQAIRCYERWSGMAVTVHDLGGALKAYLGPSRQVHATDACVAVKRATDNAPCLRWDTDQLRAALIAQPRGRVHVCHAGLVEMVAPVMRGGALELVLFAGQRSPGPGLRAVRDPGAGEHPLDPVRLAEIGDDEAAQALEGLRQLGSRLRVWLDQTLGSLGAERMPAPTDRNQAIHHFILTEHHRGIGLADLARHLGLSVHRAAHVVRAACGRTFIALLTDARLRSACAMLTHTDLAVPEVARRSGFGDADHFHRVFRRRLRTTPGRFRRTGPTQEA